MIARLKASATALLVCLLIAPGGARADNASDFERACLKVGGASEVCACKAKAAVKLLDDRMLGLVIVSMTDPGGFAKLAESGVVTDKDNATWTNYIRESNRVCNLNY